MALKFDKDFKVDDKLKHIAFIMDGNGRWAKKDFYLDLLDISLELNPWIAFCAIVVI